MSVLLVEKQMYRYNSSAYIGTNQIIVILSRCLAIYGFVRGYFD